MKQTYSYRLKLSVAAVLLTSGLFSGLRLNSAPIASAAGQFSALAAISPSSPLVNQGAGITVSVTDSGASATNVLVDLEIYNATNQKVFQKYFENQNFSSNQTIPFQFSFSPSLVGSYTIKTGVFAAGWSQLYSWENNSLTFTAVSGQVQQFAISGNAGTPVLGQQLPISVSVQNAGYGINSLVDFEIYNSSNQKVFQVFYDSQWLGSQNYNLSWTPNAAGQYVLKAGIFGSGWSSLHAWKDSVLSINVGNAQIAVTQAVAPAPQLQPAASGNPFSGAKLYVNPNSSAANQAAQWRNSNPYNASLMDKIANQSVSQWLGGWNANVYSDVSNAMSAAQNQGAMPTFVVYNIPNRDCGGYSSGGASGAGAYQSWINSIADAIGSRKAGIILEPDALPGMDCLSSADQQARLSMIHNAVETFKAKGNIAVYLDAGNSTWKSASVMAPRLQAAGIADASGFSLNVSGFISTSDSQNYGNQLSSLMGGKHYVIDSSRNGLGPTADNQWCNPSGRALGLLPSANTGQSKNDALLWIKYPGESDGNCNGGPSAGTWWADYAVGLASRASW